MYHGHQAPSQRWERGVYVLRDGRDALISYYFHFLRFVPQGNNPNIPAWLRKLFPGLTNKEDFDINFPAFLENQMQRPMGSRVHWGVHVTQYLEHCAESIPMLRYEDMLQDGFGAMDALFARLHLPHPGESAIRAAIDKLDFSKQTGRAQGQEESSHALRKGISGDWKNHYNPASRQIFHHYCGEPLIRCGYEPNDDWVH